MVDLLRPIVGKNRKEVMVIQFEGFMQNIIETFVLKLKHMKCLLLSKYPKLSKYFDMDKYQLYDSTEFMYDIDTFLKDIGCNNSYEMEDLKKICVNIDVNPVRIDTSFEVAISNIAVQDFISEIHIVKKEKYSQYEVQYMREVIFSSCRNKMYYYEGNIHDVCIDISDKLTSIFLNSPNIAYDIFQNIGENKRCSIMFFIRKNNLCSKYDFSKFDENKMNFTKIRVGPSEIIKNDGNYPLG